MRKYWLYYRTGLSQVMAYRGSLLVWLLCNFLSLATGVAVWLSVSNKGTLGGYTLSQLITYYVLGILVGWTINWNPYPGIRKDIKEGNIASTLVKPISFVGLKIMWEASWRSISAVFGLAGSLIAVLVLAKYVVVPIPSANFILLIMSFTLAASIQFMFGVCLGLLAFWFTEIEAVASMRWMALEILGGMAIPVSFIPSAFQFLVKFLPFRYMYSFPMEIIFNKVDNAGALWGFFIQASWLLFFIVVYKIMWHQGLKAYVSVSQ